MKKLLLIVPIILFSILGLNSCKKNAVEETYTETIHPLIPDLSTQLYASVSGFVTDENGTPVQGAAVKAGTNITSTDAFGYFKISNTNFAKSAGYVTVSQTGYFNGIRTFTPEAGKDNFVRLQLIPKIITGNCNSSTGGTISTAEGASVTLPASGFVVASNNAQYSGTVHAAIHWLNPAEQGILQLTMPGNLEGIDSLGYLQSLTTYGMLAVELTGDAGELLQLAPGHKASLNFPIPASLQSSAPATLPLWYFNEGNGLWQQDGSATKNGSSYQGDVSHFSFWNCDVPSMSLVYFHAQVIDANLEPILNAQVTISIQGVPNSARTGYTNADGQVSGLIPANSNLLIEITTASVCNSNNGAYSKNFTTTTANVDLGVLTVQTGSFSATLTGLVNDCNGNPVTDGYVIIAAGNQSNAVEINNGSFNASIIVCPNTTGVLTAVDRVLEQQSTSQNITIISGGNSFGTITACNAVSGEYITYWIDNVPTTLTIPQCEFTGNHNLSPDTTTIAADDLINMVTAFSADFSGPITNSPGIYQVTSSYIVINQLIYTVIDPGPVSVNVTNYNAVGNYITGTTVPFQVADMGGNLHTFKFIFNVIRDN